MATYTLTTSAQEVGKNLTPVVGARLLAWYTNATSTGATVHLKLQARSQGLTYTGTNKDYEMTLGSTATGTVGWSYAPLPADTWVDVREITQTLNFGASAGVSGKVWTYVYGDAWITGNSVKMPDAPKKPEKPTSTIASTTTNSITVSYGTSSFNNPSTGTVYLYGGTATAPTTQLTSKTTTGTSNYTHSNLTNNTKYYYRARANNGQWSDYSTENYGYTKPAALSAKSATVASTTSIKISYTTAAGGTALTKNIQYSLDNTNWTTGATVSAGTATSGNFTISNLTPGTAYTVYLRVNTSAGSTASGSVTATTYKVPDTPTVSVTNASVTSNTVTYGTASFNTPASGTVYLYGGTSSTPTTQLASKTTTGNSNYTHSGLAANTTYYYRAKANNAGGSSAYSSVKSVVTRPAAATISIDGIGLTAIRVNYSVPADGGAQPRQIKYSLDGGTTYTSVTTLNTGAASSGNFTISNLSEGTYYTIQVMVSNQSGGSFSTISQQTAGRPWGGTTTVDSRTWNTVTLTGTITSYNYPPNSPERKLAIGVRGLSDQSPVYKRENQVWLVTSATTTVTNSSIYPAAQPLTLCGCEAFYPYVWAWNSVASSLFLEETAYYLPPAPLATLSVDTLTPGSQDVTATFEVAGAAADGTNNKVGSLVNTEYRYKAGTGSFSAWTTVGTNETPNTSHTVTLTGLPFDTMVTVEARQSFSGQYSETKSLTFTTNPKQYTVYGPVNGETKTISKLYGPIQQQVITSLSGTIRTGGVGNVTAFDPDTFLSAVSGSLASTDIEYIEVICETQYNDYSATLYFASGTVPPLTYLVRHGTYANLATYGITAASNPGGNSGSDFIDLTPTIGTVSVTKEITKLYGSVNGLSKRIF